MLFQQDKLCNASTQKIPWMSKRSIATSKQKKCNTYPGHPAKPADEFATNQYDKQIIPTHCFCVVFMYLPTHHQWITYQSFIILPGGLSWLTKTSCLVPVVTYSTRISLQCLQLLPMGRKHGYIPNCMLTIS